MAQDRHPSTMMFRIDEGKRLRHRVYLGELKPAEAEREAERLGLAPFESHPSAFEFDPQSKSRWSLAMTLSWIVWRDLKEVRACDNKNRERCVVWHPFHHPLPTKGRSGSPVLGYITGPLNPTSGMEFEAFGYLPADRDEARMLSPDTPRLAKADLWGKLQDGELTAEGIPAQGGPRIQIPAREWVDLVNGRGRDPGDEFFRYRHDSSRRVYEDVVWRRIDVMRLWHAHGAGIAVAAEASSVHRRAPRSTDSPDFMSWVESRMGGNEPPPTRREAEEWARHKRLTAEWARKAHSELAPSLKLRVGETPQAWRTRHPLSEK